MGSFKRLTKVIYLIPGFYNAGALTIRVGFRVPWIVTDLQR